MRVGESIRVFSLVLFSDKYAIGTIGFHHNICYSTDVTLNGTLLNFFKGERIICINAETGKDNKFAGKMAGPYAQLVPLHARDTALAVPHLSTQMHVLKLSGEVSTRPKKKCQPHN